MAIGLINTLDTSQKTINDNSNDIPFVKMYDSGVEVFSKSLDDHISDSRQNYCAY